MREESGRFFRQTGFQNETGFFLLVISKTKARFDKTLAVSLSCIYMTTYKVWIEIEAFDTEREEGRNVDALHFASTGTFDTLNEAVAFADALNNYGEVISFKGVPMPDGFQLVDKP